MSNEDLVAPRLLARNVGLTLSANLATPLLALAGVPVLIRELGRERFGLLALIWMVIGQSALFDFGIGRAITQHVSQALADGGRDLGRSVWTALTLALALGGAGGALIAALAPTVADSLVTRPSLQSEALLAFYLLACAMPFIAATSSLSGLLEAHQRFGAVAAINIPTNALTFVGPVLVLEHTHSVAAMAALIAATRVSAAVSFFAVATFTVPDLRRTRGVDRVIARKLFRFSGWLTLSSVTAPILLSMDRFLIATVDSVESLGSYAVPFELAMRTLLIPAAIATVFFPALSHASARDPERMAELASRATRYLVVLLFPVMVVLAIGARPALEAFMGGEFRPQSMTILQILALGVFFNSLARVPLAVLMSAGRTRTIAIIHLLEVPMYLVIAGAMIRQYGIVGAATAWSTRSAIDLALLAMASRGHRTQARPQTDRTPTILTSATVGAIAVATTMLPVTIELRIALGAVWLTLGCAFAWRRLLAPSAHAAVPRVLDQRNTGKG